MVKKVSDFIRTHHMIEAGDSVIAAVSGGADSVALLLLLSELAQSMRFHLYAVHVEHGIRGEESLKDMRFTKELCAKMQVPLRICHVDAPAYAECMGLGMEEAARELRYKMLEKAAGELRHMLSEKAADGLPCSIKIALAHHLQDQAETVLFRLARGSGLHGLAGMQPVRESRVLETPYKNLNCDVKNPYKHQTDDSENLYKPQIDTSEIQPDRMRDSLKTQSVYPRELSIIYIRPLLAISRGEIEDYLSARGQGYCVDSTNHDESYARNRIRSRVLPELAEVNAQAAAHIAQTAEQAAEISDYIAGEASGALKRMSVVEEEPLSDGIRGISLEIPELFRLHPALQKEVLRQALIRVAGHEKDITAGHVSQLLELAEKTSGKEVSLPYQVRATREFDLLTLRRGAVDVEFAGLEIGAEQLEELKETEEELKIVSGASEEVVLKICWTTEPEAGGISDTYVDRRSGPAMRDIRMGENGRSVVSDMDDIDTGKTCRKYFAYEKLKDGFAIRHRQPGDYFRMKDGHRKKLKQYLIDEKIPVSERPKLLLLAQGSQVLWLLGGRADMDFAPDENTDTVISVEYRGSFTENIT